MDTGEFLRHVLPDTGPYCICNDWKTATTKGYRHFPAKDIDEAVAIARRLDSEKQNVFFAVGALVVAREWDAQKQRFRTSRLGTNIRALRSYILDLDAGLDSSGKPRQYETVDQAAAVLKQFVKAARLPRPTITSSGNGLHVYWRMAEEVPEAAWEQYGAQLKALALGHGLMIDAGRTADSSSVLRVAGTHNYKYAPPPPVEVLLVGDSVPNAFFHSLLGVTVDATPTSLAAPTTTNNFGSNTNRHDEEPLDLRKLVENCQAFRYVADPENQARGSEAIPEPAWLAAIMLVSHAHKGRVAAHLISEHDPRYDRAHVDQKFDQLVTKGIGPATCDLMQKAFATHATNADCCAGCPSKGKIKSPAVIARFVPKAAPIVVQDKTDEGSVVERVIPDPPEPFIRTSRGIGIKVANAKTGAPDVLDFCPYDMYPTRLRIDEKTQLEDDVRWRVHIPKEGWTDVDVPHSSTQQIRTVLMKRGVYIDEPNVPHMARLMSVYMRKLQNEIPREVAFAKLGWRKDGGFVVGTTLYLPDGSSEAHGISHNLQRATEGGVVTAGDYEMWRRHIQIYGRSGLEPYRCYLYSTFGSIFYHMTGQIATVISATGVTGVGKSTLMDACASVWGDPSLLMIRGDKNLSTRAAAEVRADSMHHLPVWMDEITGRDPKDVAELIFNYSGGKGKIRSTAAGGIRADTATWSNLLLVNANTDEYERISSVFRDAAQHMMRLVQLDFPQSDAIEKGEGDTLRGVVHEHFGHAGHLFAEYVVSRYDEIKKRVRDANVQADRAVGAKSEERFWTAWIACTRVAAEIASQLGILQGFPITADVQWMYRQIDVLRHRTTAQMPEPGEVMAEFLDSQLLNTLTIGSKGANNIDNIIREPRAELNIRYETDTGVMWVSRQVFKDYCAERGVNFGRTMAEMETNGHIRRNSVMKVLGADTTFSKGKVRCIELDVNRMGGKLVVISAVPQIIGAKNMAGMKP